MICILLSVVIPTLNAGAVLGVTLDSIASAQADLPWEILIVDGGSVDNTALIAAAKGAIFLEAPRGRGQQLAAAVPETSGEWLLFLHADTRLSSDWAKAARQFTADPANALRAGYFRFALDDDARAARMVEVLVALRCWLFRLPYGDQGLMISRAHYEALGGYKRIPLMEDVDLVGRIGGRNLRCLDAQALTSAARYRRDGYLMRPLSNLLRLSLYSLGVSPRFLASRYR